MSVVKNRDPLHDTKGKDLSLLWLTTSFVESSETQKEGSEESASQKQDSRNEQRGTNDGKENSFQSRGSRNGRVNGKKKLKAPKPTENASANATEPVSNSTPSGNVPSETDSASITAKEPSDAKSSRTETADKDSESPPVVPRAASYFTHDVRGKTSYGCLPLSIVVFRWSQAISLIVRRVTASGSMTSTEKKQSVVINEIPKHSRLRPSRIPRGTGVTSVSNGVTWLAIVP